ncbi:MAG: hypothetical protein U9R41_02320 [Candidatus Marinimicrobia bacterium]|nr:hypothetical protein [Candidatus Neomarinimicrobiota bacterium]
MKKHKLIFGTIFVIVFLAILNAEQIQLNPIELSGKDGGYASGEKWNSNSLLGSKNVIIYADPDKMHSCTELINKIEKLRSKNDNFNITYIVNTEATIIPTWFIRSKIKKKEKNHRIFPMFLIMIRNLLKNRS